jgi:hypothetical protein
MADRKRLAEVRKRGLKNGAHRSVEQGMCAMEAFSYIRRIPFTDHPPCVSPVIAGFMRNWNDALPDAERNILIPLLPKLIDTVNPALEQRRSLMAADWLVRVHTPAWLRLAGLVDNAEALEKLPEITGMAQIPSIRGPLEAARKNASAAWDAAGAAARAAAGDAAGAAAWDAAWDAAGAAAWDAAWDAAGAAARAAAGDAAGAAARAAAWAAAGAAARAALAPTKAALQKSAIKLVERMCALTDEPVQEAA